MTSASTVAPANRPTSAARSRRKLARSKAPSVCSSRVSRKYSCADPSLNSSSPAPNRLFGRSAPLAIALCTPSSRVASRTTLEVSLATRELGVQSAIAKGALRSEEHTSELQSRQYLVCRLLLEKKKRQ